MGEDTTQEFPKNSLAVILARFESMEGSLRSEINSLSLRMGSFESRLTSLDEKVDWRLMETRPIWERVLSRLDSIEVRLNSLVKGFDRVEEDFEDMGLTFRTFQNDLLRMQTSGEIY